jgi:hypothetical protein
MSHCEEHLYHSARQGLIDVPGLDENLVSVNPERVCYEIFNFMDSNSSLCFDGIGHLSVSVSITGVPSVVP